MEDHGIIHGRPRAEGAFIYFQHNGNLLEIFIKLFARNHVENLDNSHRF